MQTSQPIDPSKLDDQTLLRSLQRVVAFERDATATVVAHLAEVDVRGLHRDAGYSSLFAYCTGALRMSEAESYARIHAARLSRRFSSLLPMLREGSLNLTTLQVLGPKLTADNCTELLQLARGLSKRSLEEKLAARFEQPAVPQVVRKLPAARAAALPEVALPLWAREEQQPTDPVTPAVSTPASLPAVTPALRAPSMPVPAARAVVAPLSAERFKVQMTFSRAQCDKLHTARDLLRHRQPDGDLAAVIERALDLLIAHQLEQRFALTERPKKARTALPKPGSRHIPHAVRREVFKRDGGRCTFVSPDGHRCSETAWLELDHRHPHALRGAPTADNIRLLCRAHNQLQAERHFGPLFMQDKRATLSGERCRE